MITALTMYIILKVIKFSDEQPKNPSPFMGAVGIFVMTFGALAIITAYYMDVQVAHILQSFVHSLQ